MPFYRCVDGRFELNLQVTMGAKSMIGYCVRMMGVFLISSAAVVLAPVQAKGLRP